MIDKCENPVSSETIDYLISNYGDDAKKWIDNIDDTIMKLCKKWRVSITGYEPNSRFGCILYGKKENVDVVMKLVPPCCLRLKQEIECYFLLPYHNMVDFYDCDYELGAFLIKRIFSLPNIELTHISDMFSTMYNERKTMKNVVIGDYKTAFYASLDNAWDVICKCDNLDMLHFLNSITKAKETFDKTAKEPFYILHGDVHIHNILYDSKQVYLIDPIGYIGPFEIEYARFLGTYIRENNLYASSLTALIKSINRNDSMSQNIIYALGYDVTMRACNTFLEGNTRDEIFDAIMWAENIWKLIDTTL